MKILIISGFLGSGKTSFIQAMAKATGREFVIVENEFGELGVDGEILRQDERLSETDAQMKIWELSEGCICCSLNLDFSMSVLTIYNALSPDYLIVEPSGVAMLSSILSQLEKVRYGEIDLLAPVTMVDYENYKLSRKDFGQYFEDQVDSAGVLVLSKSESLSSEAFKAIKEELKVGDDVLFPLEHYSKWDRSRWNSLLMRRLVFTKDKKATFEEIKIPKKQELESLSIKDVQVKSPDELFNLLEKLTSGEYGRIVRAKGYMGKKHFFRFELVEGKYMITGMENVLHPRIVIIGQKLKRGKIRNLFSIKPSKPMKLIVSNRLRYL